MRFPLCLALLIGFDCLAAQRVIACCMVPRDFAGSIGQAQQRAIIFHRDGREELILSISYQIKGDATPDRFAWIVTTPAEPDSYRVAPSEIFDEAAKWADPILTATGSRVAASAKAESGLEFGIPAEVGPYRIQPVRARGEEALAGLNEWLAANGFPTEDPEHMKWFVKNGFTFLCIKVTPPAEKDAVGKSGAIAPLQISFVSPRIYYPLKFSSRQGVFDVDLTVLSGRPIDFEASADSLARLSSTAQHRSPDSPVDLSAAPDSLKQALREGKVARGTGDKWYLTVVQAYRVNSDKPIAEWPEDIFFDLKK